MLLKDENNNIILFHTYDKDSLTPVVVASAITSPSWQMASFEVKDSNISLDLNKDSY